MFQIYQNRIYVLIFVQLQKLSLLGGETSLFWWSESFQVSTQSKEDMKNWYSNHDNRQSLWKDLKKLLNLCIFLVMIAVLSLFLSRD